MDSRLPSPPTISSATTDSSFLYREYTPGELLSSIDWVYFFFAWGISPEHPQAAALRREAETMLRRLADNGQVAFQYVDGSGRPSLDITANPNGSLWAIEGITSPDGRVLGKMGHSERAGSNVARNIPGSKLQPLFEGGVEYFK